MTHTNQSHNSACLFDWQHTNTRSYLVGQCVWYSVQVIYTGVVVDIEVIIFIKRIKVYYLELTISV